MPDILSQSEIDELLNALAQGTADINEEPPVENVGKVSVYDFRTANKFPKEQVRTLNIIFQTYGQLLANQLTGLLQSPCDVDLLSVEELTFNEFSNSLPTPAVLAIMELEPLESALLMQISSETVYSIVSRLFGGSSGRVERGKPLTEIEMAITERILRQTMPLFEEAWTKVLRVSASLTRMETSSQFTQIVGINEPVAIITLSIKIGNESGLINICLPRVAIEPVSKQLNTRLWFAGTQTKEIVPRGDIISKKVVNTEVTLRVTFNDTVATVQDVVNLQPGDVIRLNQRVEAPLTVNVQHIPKFRAVIGTKSSRYAVKIVDIIRGENNDE